MERFEIDAYDRLLRMVGEERVYHYDALLNDFQGSYRELTDKDCYTLRFVVNDAIDKYGLLYESAGTIRLTDLGEKVRRRGMERFINASYLCRLFGLWW